MFISLVITRTAGCTRRWAIRLQERRKSLNRISKMLEHLTLRITIATLFFASAIKCVPFKLTSSTKLLVEPFKRTPEIWLWYLATFTTYCHGIFQIVSFCFTVWTHGFDKDSAPHFFFLTVALFSMLFYGNAFWKPNETVYHINCISILMQQSMTFT